MRSIETQGKTVDQAIEIGLYKLGVSRDQVKISILEQAGLFNKARVRLSLDQSSETENNVKELAEKLTNLMGVNVDVFVEETEENFIVDITGEDAAIFIGKHGENLESFGFLLNSIYNKNKKSDEYKRVVVDSNGYKGKREETLRVLAVRTASRVVSTGRSVKLEPMSANERRIIHSALAEHSKVETVSNGKEPYRYITVMLKNAQDKRKQKNKERKENQPQSGFTNLEVIEPRVNND